MTHADPLLQTAWDAALIRAWREDRTIGYLVAKFGAQQHLAELPARLLRKPTWVHPRRGVVKA